MNVRGIIMMDQSDLDEKKYACVKYAWAWVISPHIFRYRGIAITIQGIKFG